MNDARKFVIESNRVGHHVPPRGGPEISELAAIDSLAERVRYQRGIAEAVENTVGTGPERDAG